MGGLKTKMQVSLEQLETKWRSLRKEFLLESEEIAMKLDLLAGDGEKEKLERRRHETML